MKSDNPSFDGVAHRPSDYLHLYGFLPASRLYDVQQGARTSNYRSVSFDEATDDEVRAAIGAIEEGER